MDCQPDFTTAQDATAVQTAFTNRRATAFPKVASVVRGRGLPDEDSVLTEVWVRAWPAFPPMHRRELDALATGHPSPHHWDAWFCQIARHLVVDELRRLKTFPRRTRHRSTTLCPSAGLTTPAAATDHSVVASPHVVPIDPTFFADPESSDPVLIAERAELRAILAADLAALHPKQRAAITMWADRFYDADAAHTLGVSRFALYRLRDRAITHLRTTFRDHGYDVPTNRYSRPANVPLPSTEGARG